MGKFWITSGIVVVAVLSHGAFARAQSCEQIFDPRASEAGILNAPSLSKAVSAGYRLNPETLKRAFDEPATRWATYELVQAAHLTENGPAQLLMNFSELSHDAVALKNYIRATTSPPMASGAADLIVSAMIKLNSRVIQPSSEPQVFDLAKVVRAARLYFRDKALAHHLPNFREVLDAHPKLFLNFAGSLYTTAVTTKLNPADAEVAIRAYERSLAASFEDAAKAADPFSFEKKAILAINASDPLYRAVLIKLFRARLTTDPEILASIGTEDLFVKKKNVREALWQRGGAILIELLVRDVLIYQSGPLSEGKLVPTPTPELLRAYLLTVLPDTSPYYPFLLGAIQQRLLPNDGRQRDPEKIRRFLRESLVPVGSAIRHKIKEIDTAKRLEVEASRRATPIPAPQTKVSKPKASVSEGGIRVASVQGNLVKKVAPTMEEKLEAELNSGSQEATALSAHVAQASRGVPALESLLTEKVETGVRYAFKFKDYREENFVVFEESLLKEMTRLHFDLKPWIAAFLTGPTMGHSTNGIKFIHGTNGNVRSVKLLSTPYRILMVRDKNTGAWHWRTIVNRYRVDDYCHSHGLM